MRTTAEFKDLMDRLTIRARIRRQAKGRRSVEEGVPDRLAALLEEAADALDELLRANESRRGT